MFEVRVYPKFEKHARDFHENIKARLKELICDLEENPVPVAKYDLKRAAGRKATYRVRIAYVRIIYEVEWEEKIVKIIKVDRRSGNTYD